MKIEEKPRNDADFSARSSPPKRRRAAASHGGAIDFAGSEEPVSCRPCLFPPQKAIVIGWKGNFVSGPLHPSGFSILNGSPFTSLGHIRLHLNTPNEILLYIYSILSKRCQDPDVPSTASSTSDFRFFHTSSET